MKNEKEQTTEQGKGTIASVTKKLFGGTKEAVKEAAPVKQETKPAAKPEKKKGTATAERISFFQPLIESGQHTQPELVEMAVKKFTGLTESTIRTFLTDSKNPKYNKFEKLVVADDGGKLTFKK